MGWVNTWKIWGYLRKKAPAEMLRPTRWLQREMSCRETKGPRFLVEKREWRCRIWLSLLSRAVSRSSLRSRVRVSRRVWAVETGFFRHRNWVAEWKKGVNEKNEEVAFLLNKNESAKTLITLWLTAVLWLHSLCVCVSV